MAAPPPRPAAPRLGGPASPGQSPASSSGTRQKEGDKNAPGTFFLGRYRVVDEIGVGGMASVHLARMDGPGGFQKWVAIKRIHPHLVEDDQFVDMFLDEARIAAGINHANVAQVFDLGKDDNTYWIAMEYLHGEPLREVMRRAEERGQRIGPELAARICADAAEGLHAAHELRGKNGQLLGLVHRDVTPHNLFLTYDGYTKVVDFGIAKVADRLSSTRAGTLKGKLAYMSPEQVRGAEVDRTTDIFALGVVLWEITTNQRLFRMDTDLDTLEKVQACIVPPPSTIVPGYPMELESVVMKALSKRKQDRFQTGREFSRALQGYLMRSGHFVGPEEVAQFIRAVFADRIQKREAHLAWAAEVTSTVNVDQLRAGKPSTSDDPPRREEPKPPPPAPPPPAMLPGTPASGERPKPGMASQSLIDDDEDVPTTVAMRETLENALRGPGGPRPAAGLPAPQPMPNSQPLGSPGLGPSPASYAANAASYAANRPPGGGGPTFGGNPPPQYGQAPQFGGFGPSGATPPQNVGFGPSPQQGFGGQPHGEDLGSTVALPSTLSDPVRSPTFGGQQSPQGPQSQQQNPYGSPAATNGQASQFGGFAQGGPAPQFGQQQNPQLTPAGLVGGVPMHLPAGPPGGPQSQIETALSLPRPDPHALWLAQQEKQKGDRRNAGVIIAVVVLTALCVIGIGVLVYFKYFRAKPATAEASASATAVATASAAPTASAAAAATAAPTASATATAEATASAAPSAAPQSGPPSAGGTGKAAAGKEPPGMLTVICKPYCDDVLDNGKSLGPSPVVNLPVPPGQHRLTLKKGKDTKVVSVIVVSGQLTQQRATM